MKMAKRSRAKTRIVVSRQKNPYLHYLPNLKTFTVAKKGLIKIITRKDLLLDPAAKINQISNE